MLEPLNRAHVWLFFEEAVAASVARRLGSYLLTEAMEHRPDLGFRSYDRFFPNQDTLPKGGFGNLIALPLQKRAREQGNSVFVNRELETYADQWAFLASVRRISRGQAEAWAQAAERRGKITGVRTVSTGPDADEDAPWTAPPSRKRKERPIAGPLPESIEIVLADQIYIAKDDMPPPLRNRLLGLAAFQNPEFYRAQAMRLPTYDKPRIIDCAEDYAKHIGLPRGCLAETQALLESLKIAPVVRDERYAGEALDLSFHGTLAPAQEAAAEAMLADETGVLAATTAFGKTVIAAWLMAQRGVNTLILVHRQQLLEQWVERLASFFGLPGKAIGRLGGGRKKLTGRIDVALIQSLIRKGVVDDRVGNYGHLIVDECHHLSARNFELVARRAQAKFVTGLTATVIRKDGHHPIIFMQCGPVRHRVDAKRQAVDRPFDHQVWVRPTGFRATEPEAPDVRMEFHGLYEALMHDDARNAQICQDVVEALNEGRSPLVLTERTEHLECLKERLSSAVKHLVILRGGMGKKALRAALAHAVDAGESGERVILATGGFIGEGFDDARLDTLFVTLPISWRGTVAQYAGRLHRLDDRKRQVRVYDYADLNVPMLAKMFDRRCRGYEAVGYKVLLPASAVPGWPVDVPLPLDTEWKREYSASIRRLVRDGVDGQLAGLFSYATDRSNADPEGEGRARSASEAFLFRRLETVSEAAGRFRLNVNLPIPFGMADSMEVDLLCESAHLVIEIDGAQHLADPEAYRSDRCKDRLLQENGYFVLRFLAEDVCQQLDQVLDAILRALAHRSGS